LLVWLFVVSTSRLPLKSSINLRCGTNFAAFSQFLLTFRNADVPNNSEFQSRNTKSVIPTKFLSLPLLNYLNAVDALKP